jgi:hypothetical protein
MGFGKLRGDLDRVFKFRGSLDVFAPLEELFAFVEKFRFFLFRAAASDKGYHEQKNAEPPEHLIFSYCSETDDYQCCT